jgi:hypothetical protein
LALILEELDDFKSMKNKKKVLLLVLLISLKATSQENVGKNMGKINLSSFAWKAISVQYERQVTRRVTVAVGYSKIPTSNIPFKSFIERQIDNPDVKVGDFRLGTSIFTPEVRYYVGKKGAFKGFYLAPYARFGSYKIDGPVEYTSSTNVRRSAMFSGRLTTAMGGLMIGSSFTLPKKNLYLDWWIIGASFGGGDGFLSAVTPLTKDEQTSIKNTINNIELPSTRLYSQVDEKGATVTTTGKMVGLRGFGINIGYRF